LKPINAIYMTNRNKVIAYKLSLWIGIPVSIIGFYLHLTHNFLADFMLALGSIGALVIFILGLIDVLSYNTIRTSEKVMWICGFIFITYITGLVYFKNFKRHLISLS